MLTSTVLSLIASASFSSCTAIARRQSNTTSSSIESCPGYTASNVVQSGSSFTADLNLAGPACNTYGTDIQNLTLSVDYQTAQRLHVQIYDQAEQVYQVPDSVLPRPNSSNVDANSSELSFTYTANPFSFAVTRKSSGDVLFNTSGSALVFESQYLRLRTQLPDSPHLYGLGEHTDPFQLNTTNYTRTLWSRDAYTIPTGTNLYGNHPVYFDHRGASGTHGVFLLNSNGMDIKINNTAQTGQYLEYNTLGGIVDLYFMAGPSPTQVSQQYAQVVGLPVMMPYWGFGFHQCRYGMQDVWEVSEVVSNYSAANIPLETMWTDIDYMDYRKVFTLDPDRFPLNLMQELVSTIHSRQQHYIVMVDPAVAYYNYTAFNNGASANAFLKFSNGSIYEGVVWPGPTAFPDWFAPGTQDYWNGEFASFFDATNGVDIDALWIDMNEASNFCHYPCSDPQGYANSNGDPPQPPPVRASPPYPAPGFPANFQPNGTISKRQASGDMLGLPGRDFINPPYQISDAAGSISNLTLNTDLIHANGLAEYDTHNLYGTMMSVVSRNAMLNRRPADRPLVITRSTFAGAGAHVGHWLGDNPATWDGYRISIAEQLEFAALFQVPMVGSDVCGYTAYDTSDQLCARWSMLGAFSPFYRDHQDNEHLAHEFYRSYLPMTNNASRVAINTRYLLLDYIYTALYQQTQDGTPLLNPMFFIYPNDTNTFPLQLQFFFGNALLIAPVTDDNSTSVTYYLPDDIYYDWWTREPVRGNGSYVTEGYVGFDGIPIFYRGGTIIPQRISSANTTAELRKQDFEIVVAPGLDGSASGTLYLDEGNSIDQPQTSNIEFSYEGGVFKMTGSFGYDPGVSIAKITLLGSGGGNSTSTNTSLTTQNKEESKGISLTAEYTTKLA
ncbi:glycoside hydrolase family 31 protein [Viridothelium virens]|uniref:Glycoside hydrolase family 31 protein n=1 Tax=Viridothelium virens TaxID=1048519 RepID=A0A6A6HDU2_VIRVR|nr:glycoside hydrolase family 31 protein [Viridothelium virens]